MGELAAVGEDRRLPGAEGEVRARQGVIIRRAHEKDIPQVVHVVFPRPGVVALQGVAGKKPRQGDIAQLLHMMGLHRRLRYGSLRAPTF